MPRRDGDRLCRSNHAYASTKAKRGRRGNLYTPVEPARGNMADDTGYFYSACFSVPLSKGVCVVMCVWLNAHCSTIRGSKAPCDVCSWHGGGDGALTLLAQHA